MCIHVRHGSRKMAVRREGRSGGRSTQELMHICDMKAERDVFGRKEGTRKETVQ